MLKIVPLTSFFNDLDFTFLSFLDQRYFLWL